MLKFGLPSKQCRTHRVKYILLHKYSLERRRFQFVMYVYLLSQTIKAYERKELKKKWYHKSDNLRVLFAKWTWCTKYSVQFECGHSLWASHYQCCNIHAKWPYLLLWPYSPYLSRMNDAIWRHTRYISVSKKFTSHSNNNNVKMMKCDSSIWQCMHANDYAIELYSPQAVVPFSTCPAVYFADRICSPLIPGCPHTQIVDRLPSPIRTVEIVRHKIAWSLIAPHSPRCPESRLNCCSASITSVLEMKNKLKRSIHDCN